MFISNFIQLNPETELISLLWVLQARGGAAHHTLQTSASLPSLRYLITGGDHTEWTEREIVEVGHQYPLV